MRNFLFLTLMFVIGLVSIAFCIIGLIVNPGLTISIWFFMWLFRKLDKIGASK